MKCTDKSDDTTLLSSSNNTAVDDMSKCINKVTLEDVNNDTPPRDISSSGEEDINSEKKSTSCEQNLESTDQVGVDTSSGSAADSDMVSKEADSDADTLGICANCGKEGANNTCNKCKMVKYCNAACKKKHRHKHKEDCEAHLKHLAELQEEERRLAAELHYEQLFKQPPPINDDCPICFQRLSFLDTGRRYKSCCGKIICSGCVYAVVQRTKKTAMPLCPFCRTPTPTTDKMYIEMIKSRVDAGDTRAINNLGSYYSNGAYSLPQDHAKAFELYHRAAELDSTEVNNFLGNAYCNGNGVERDINKANHYWEKGAMEGCPYSRFMLGIIEKTAVQGNMDRSIKHFMIAVADGHNGSLKEIKQLFSQGHVTKDEYTEALRAYQKYLDEVKSSQRDEAAAARENYKYIE